MCNTVSIGACHRNQSLDYTIWGLWRYSWLLAPVLLQCLAGAIKPSCAWCSLLCFLPDLAIPSPSFFKKRNSPFSHNLRKFTHWWSVLVLMLATAPGPSLKRLWCPLQYVAHGTSLQCVFPENRFKTGTCQWSDGAAKGLVVFYAAVVRCHADWCFHITLWELVSISMVYTI